MPGYDQAVPEHCLLSGWVTSHDREGVNTEVIMLSTEDKMYQVAKYFGDLNRKGNVKGFKANERGYARVKDIVRGCGLFVVHTNNEELMVYLMVTPTALTRYEATCKRAVTTFKNFLGSDVEQRKWTHAIANGERDLYSVDVTNRELPEIFKLVDELKGKLLFV